MKIHVLGCNGMLGTYVSKYFKSRGYTVEDYDRSRCNVYNFYPEAFGKTLHSSDVVVNCIGLLKPNIQSFDHAVDVNLNFPLQLDMICAEVGCNLVNFSSDCVYSGSKGSYIETDTCDADDWYGQTKRQENIKSTVMRVSFIGEERYHKIGLLEFARKNAGKEVSGYTNCLWNGLSALQIAKLIERMVRADGVTFWSGTRHVYSAAAVSKYGMLKMIDDVYNLGLTVIPVEAKAISGSAVYGTLDRTLATIYNTIETPSLAEMIREQKNYIYEH
jgi:dTDP-4-dehydrorhamnose reductase